MSAITHYPCNFKFLLLSFFFFLLHPILPTSDSQPITSSHDSHSHPHPLFPCTPPHHSLYPFCNTSLPTSLRAQTLISLLTLPEKLLQLGTNASAVPRLGIPPYYWWSESLHGINANGPGVNFLGPIPAATNFPQVILTAAGFNRSLWRSVAAAIAVEGRAMYNVGQAGLTFWAPNINVFRDPRWGRGQETPGEDPVVAAAFAVEFVEGFQEVGERRRSGAGVVGGKRMLMGDGNGGGDGGGMMLSACCKHYTAYDLESWGGFTRYNFNAVVSYSYIPPFILLVVLLTVGAGFSGLAPLDGLHYTHVGKNAADLAGDE